MVVKAQQPETPIYDDEKDVPLPDYVDEVRIAIIRCKTTLGDL